MAEDPITIADKSTGEELSADEFNQLLDALKDGTKSIEPESIVIPSGTYISFFASDGTTEVARLTDDGNLLLKGGVGKL